ncbi:hypothetical protein ACLNGM_20315 [Aureimonas phyllosphaerae]|uniref:hypothetical protein n=1 Tax=Aureimonas phyllosphaerae TaxID=1166078 RepID=UPI003A5C428A
MMDGRDVYLARLQACLAEAAAATLPQVKERHLAAARSWQVLLDHALELKQPNRLAGGPEDHDEREIA